MKTKEIMVGIKNNKGKTVLLAIYLLATLILPLTNLLPYSQHKIDQHVRSSLLTAVPQDIDAYFRQYFSLIKEGSPQEYTLMAPELRNTVSSTSMQAITDYFANTTDQMSVVGTRTVYTSGRKDYNVTYEVSNNDPVNKYIEIEFSAEDTGNGIQMFGIHYVPETQSVLQWVPFKFTKENIILVIIAFAIPLFVAYTALRYISMVAKPKWWLFLVILLVSLYFSITGGDFYHFYFGVQSFIQRGGLAGPWIAVMPIPFGAIYYYFVRNKLENKDLEA